ncbi:hypothetical protein chiPu_0027051 [Chiloscyllium punctatum]|uniref:Uncharacterized protein n=1 Tax=Chiloscyllium punctatum TaxID=137246 RepID=A0A401TJU8_CHIPU|nr:hypothetical protein [Chiloscyllium punctatum]
MGRRATLVIGEDASQTLRGAGKGSDWLRRGSVTVGGAGQRGRLEDRRVSHNGGRAKRAIGGETRQSQRSGAADSARRAGDWRNVMARGRGGQE